MTDVFQNAPAEGTQVPPRTTYEEAVAAIWREVLDRADIGALDDFFELNGTSLQAISVVTRIRETWGIDISARDFFECPTVEALAAFLDADSPPARPPVTPRPPGATPVLSYDQRRLWLEDQLRQETAYNVHVRHRLIGPLDVTALERGVRAIVARHESLRTRFGMEGGQPVQIVDEPNEDWKLDIRDVTAERGDALVAAEALADEQAVLPFDLALGPLLRCLLIRVSEDDHVLAVTAHHIVCDNWSIGLFVQELTTLYDAGGDPGRAGLAPLDVQYRDYAVWQQRWLTGDALATQVDYWRRHLHGAPAAIALPTTGRRRATTDGRGGRLRSQLSEQDSTVITELCRGYGVTPFMAVVATLATVLSRWSAQESVVIGVPVTVRGDPAIERLIGFFVNTIPLHVDLSGDPTFADLLSRVRQSALGGYANADVPFDLLLTELRVPRDPARAPVFQVLVNAIDGHGDQQLRGVTAVGMDGPVPPSKLDMTLSIRDLSGGLSLELDYNADRYKAAMMRMLFDQVGVLLRAAADDPARGIRDYALEPG